MTKTVNSRELILKILMEVLENEQYSNIVIKNTLDKYAFLEKNERSFIKRISEGTIEKLIEMDYIINSFSKIKVRKMKPEVRNILRLSVYQIKYMNSVPDRAVCNEAVKLIQKTRYKDLKSFVNGVLRNICREIDNVRYPEPKEKVKYLSVKYSMPEWIIEKWLKEYKEDVVVKLLEGFDKDRGTVIRVNNSKISNEDLTKELLNQNIKVKSRLYLENALEISDYDSITSMESFKTGMFYVQDTSSMFVGAVADPKKNDYCIDVCAAPGGKSLHLAELLNNTGMVDSRDISESKTNLIRENIERTGFKNIKVITWDALNYDKNSEQKADIVIADLPCSGLGIIGKKNDIKFKINKNRMEELQKLQRDILNIVNNYVKIGGILIYSTCTISRDENEENVNWFIKNYPFETVSLNEIIPTELQNNATENGYIQFLPGIHDTDGFFIAKLRRKA